jgi:hypothetical protein
VASKTRSVKSKGPSQSSILTLNAGLVSCLRIVKSGHNPPIHPYSSGQPEGGELQPIHVDVHAIKLLIF